MYVYLFLFMTETYKFFFNKMIRYNKYVSCVCTTPDIYFLVLNNTCWIYIGYYNSLLDVLCPSNWVPGQILSSGMCLNSGYVCLFNFKQGFKSYE